MSRTGQTDLKWTTEDDIDFQTSIPLVFPPRSLPRYFSLEVSVESPQPDLSIYSQDFAGYLSFYMRFTSLFIYNRGLHFPPIIAAIRNLTGLEHLTLTLGEVPDSMDLSMLEDATLEHRKLCTVTFLEGCSKGYPDAYTRAIAGLLRASSETITSLKLPAEGVQQFFGGDVHFPNLEELHIWTDMMATNPCFTATQPKLHTLVLLVCDTSFFDDKQTLQSLVQSLPSLVRLIIDFRYPSWAPNDEQVQKLIACFAAHRPALAPISWKWGSVADAVNLPPHTDSQESTILEINLMGEPVHEQGTECDQEAP